MSPRQLHLEATGHGTRGARTFPWWRGGICVCECVKEIAGALLLRDYTVAGMLGVS